jgi:hypothetical protein
MCASEKPMDSFSFAAMPWQNFDDVPAVENTECSTVAIKSMPDRPPRLIDVQKPRTMMQRDRGSFQLDRFGRPFTEEIQESRANGRKGCYVIHPLRYSGDTEFSAVTSGSVEWRPAKQHIKNLDLPAAYQRQCATQEIPQMAQFGTPTCRHGDVMGMVGQL